MDIEKVGSHVPYGHQVKNDIEKNPKTRNTDEPAPVQQESSPETKSGDNSQDANGVIQLLQQGHFSGVADVRLRIVHADKLLALEQQQLQTVAAEKVDNLLATVGNVVEPFLDAGQSQEQSVEEPAEVEPENIPELADAFAEFTSAVNTAKDEFLNGQSPAKESLLDNLNSAFQSFIELLTPALEPTPEIQIENENPTNPTESLDTISEEEQPANATVEAPDEPPSVLQSFLENLETVFAAAMEDLISSLDGAKVLPELSEPHGNGVAYDKFLAVYNNL